MEREAVSEVERVSVDIAESDVEIENVWESLSDFVFVGGSVSVKVPNVSVSEALFESELESDGVSDMDHVYVCEPEYETVRDGVDESVSEYDHDAEPE